MALTMAPSIGPCWRPIAPSMSYPQPPSIAAAYFFISPPVFGAVDAAAYAGSPFGFESCYWPAKAAEWRGRMEAQGRREDGTLR